MSSNPCLHNVFYDKGRVRYTGYVVWIFADKYWHRTLDGALRRARQARDHCKNVQIIEVETAKTVYGIPE